MCANFNHRSPTSSFLCTVVSSYLIVCYMIGARSIIDIHVCVSLCFLTLTNRIPAGFADILIMIQLFSSISRFRGVKPHTNYHTTRHRSLHVTKILTGTFFTSKDSSLPFNFSLLIMSSECVIIYFRFKATPYRRECMSNHTQLEEINILGATLIWTDKQRPDQTIKAGPLLDW